MKRELQPYEIIERDLVKRYRKTIWRMFVRGVQEYEMISPGDKIAVCISGGKDSMLLAKLMQEIKWHNQMDFELVFLMMDPGYNEDNRRQIEKNADFLQIPLHIFETQIFNSVVDIKDSPCYLCARMRRGYLYENAKSLGCNKIALGHHFDDIIETTLMGMLYGAQIQTMMPKLKSTNHPGMELIRPMCYVKEADICKWRDDNKLTFIQCACRFTEEYEHSADGIGASKRQEMKKLIETMRQINPNVDINIYRSMENVNLSTILAYKKHGIKHSFVDEYDSW